MSFSKKINISSSSILGLKAELARKQEEVKLGKSRVNFTPRSNQSEKRSLWNKKNEGVLERANRDIEEKQEEDNACEKSRKVLSAKAKLYEKLSEGYKFDDNAGDKFLVNFAQKSLEEKPKEDDVPLDFEDDSTENDDEWVDYVDCLGRSRKCLREDLPFLKEKDAVLAREVGQGREEKFDAGTECEIVEESGSNSVSFEFPFNSNDTRELMRQKWEKEELELRKKTDIHYQDVLFDEVRSHGVGYYAFSKDEEERKKQREGLDQLRRETAEKRAAAEVLKQRREEQREARLKAAKTRMRARLGLPPEEETLPKEDQSTTEEQNVEKSLEEVSNILEINLESSVKKKPHVRPWDIGKKGVSNIMDQREWVEKKRSERPEEFAPPSFYRRQERSVGNQVNLCKPVSKEDGQKSFNREPLIKVPVQIPKKDVSSSNDLALERTGVNLRHNRESVKCTTSTAVSEKPSVISIEELSSGESDTEDNQRRNTNKRGVEIPPPASFDYYGPAKTTKRHKSAPSKADMEQAINAGLLCLEKQRHAKGKQREKGLLPII